MNKKLILSGLFISLFSLLFYSCNKNNSEDPIDYGFLQIVSVNVGSVNLNANDITRDVPVDQNIIISFSAALDTLSAVENILLKGDDGMVVPTTHSFLNGNKTISLSVIGPMAGESMYAITIGDGLKGSSKESFAGIVYSFETLKGSLTIKSILINGQDLNVTSKIINVDVNVEIVVEFSASIDRSLVEDNVKILTASGTIPAIYSYENDDKKLIVNSESSLLQFSRYGFRLFPDLSTPQGYDFEGFYKEFYTSVDSTYKFPEISDEELLTKVQEQTFKYFWDFGHLASGMARERNTSGNTITSGGSGFGIMALIVGVERGFVTRSEVLTRMDKILNFLETCDRYHGVYAHWINGVTGKTIPFSTYDNGGDLVETSFLFQGLITFRQYLSSDDADELILINRINALYEAVEWDWYTKGENVLYWHWSPNYGFQMNMKITGYNETMISYVLAGGSELHGIDKIHYTSGYARNGAIKNGNSYYGITLPLGGNFGGPLFFAHYSFLGLDPRNLSDQYANYWDQNVNHSLINRAYCIDNPKEFVGYGNASWGLTASDNPQGYSAHSPTNDLGVITPTAALSSMPYTPEYSMDALRYFYYILGDKMWGQYGFYDAYSATDAWYATSYLAIDQGPIILMIENYRTGLLWDLFMSAPEIQSSLTKLGFTY